jgi:tRNA(Ile)-lysidine synthetase-like protein
VPHATAALFDKLGPWNSDQKVAIGFSGGADSVFLALAWRDYCRQLPELASIQTQLWVVDHQHHAGSAQVAQAAAAIAESLALGEVRVLRPSEWAPPAPAGEGEQALRWLRYACFSSAAGHDETDILLLGHQADDQAETLLLRILRGTGMFGLAGIPERRLMERSLGPKSPASLVPLGSTEVRRPLLSLRRAEIRRRLCERGQPWLPDPSNDDPLYASRNGVRLEGLPLLARWATGDPVRALLRLQREAEDWKRSEVEGVLELIHSGTWVEAAGPQRRRAIQIVMQRAGYTTHPARLHDLEGALLRRGSANLDEQARLTIAGGALRLVPRRDVQVDGSEGSQA